MTVTLLRPRWIVLVVMAFFAGAGMASATPFAVTGVAFVGGTGSFSGTFNFDPATGIYSDVSIDTDSLGSNVHFDSAISAPVPALGVAFVRSSDGPVYLGDVALLLSFLPGLAAPTPSVLASALVTCTNSDCSSGIQIVVYSPATVSAVPEPSAAAFLGIGLAGLFLFSKVKRRSTGSHEGKV